MRNWTISKERRATSGSFIILVGNNGAGKTTFSRFIGEALGWHVLKDKAAQSNYLNDFLSDKGKWSFHNQVQFITSKFEQQHAAMISARSSCQDRGAYECYEVFTRRLADNGLMDDRDFQCITNMYLLLSNLVRKPDLIVYLHAPVNVLLGRVERRAREIDRGMTIDDLRDMEHRYNSWIQSIDWCPILSLDTDLMNLAEDVSHREAAIEKVRAALTGPL